MLLDYVRIDIGAGKKSQHDRAEASDVIDPWGEREPTVLPAIAPTTISNRAAEIVIQSEASAATRASAIHSAD